MPELLIALAIVGLLNLCYYLGFFRFALSTQTDTSSEEILAVSVIICAKNEAENLLSFLPDILSQDHPNYELILVNDASWDESLEIMESFQHNDSRVKIVNVQNNEAFWANKKYALTLGIKKAKNPHLLFTDADCRPTSREWISKMSEGFKDSKSIVLGYGGYFAKKGSFLNKLIRFETLLTAIQYFSYAKWGTPYMGVGRNLAYTSKEFFDQNGFADHLHLRSGDDDLFVNQAATAKNTAICFDQSATTRSIPKSSYKEWFTQKRRHLSVGSKYKIKHQFLLGTFYLSQVLFWILAIILLFGPFWKIALGIILFRIIVQGFVFYPSARKLDEKDLIWLFPILEVFLICAQFGIFISNLISKPSHWK